MKKIVTVAATGLVLAACQPVTPAGNSNQNAEKSLKATLVITDENAEVFTSDAHDVQEAQNVVDFDKPFAKSLGKFMARELHREEAACESGNFVVTIDDNGFGEASTLPASGQFEMLFAFNDCLIEGTTMAGGISALFQWSGYSATTNQAERVAIDVTIDSLTTTGTENSFFDGVMTTTVTEGNTTLSWNVWEENAQTDQQLVNSYTTADLEFSGSSEIPTSGAWRVDGGESSYMTANVVANGVEWSSNGEQAQLKTWAEIEAGE